MMKKLIKHGNSLALVIEKPVLDLLVPIKDARRYKAFKSALGKVNEKYSGALKKLAE